MSRVTKIRLVISLVLASLLLHQESAADSRVMPDPSYVSELLSRQFYLENITPELPTNSLASLVESLKKRRLDSWATVIPDGIDRQRRATVRRRGFGLRVLRFDDKRYFLLPELNSPNETRKFRIFSVRKAPQDGNWHRALVSNELIVEGGDVAFSEDSYLAMGARINENRIRIDDFSNPALGGYFKSNIKEISEVTVIDLRFNSGGRVDLASEFIYLFAGKKIPLGSIEKRGQVLPIGGLVPLTLKELSKLTAHMQDVTVLVSRYTASSAEWLARNLQIYGARIVGERTEGKCLIQREFPIGGGQHIRIAVGKLNVTSHIENVYTYCDFGVIPDYSVEGLTLLTQSADWISRIPSAGELE